MVRRTKENSLSGFVCTKGVYIFTWLYGVERTGITYYQLR